MSANYDLILAFDREGDEDAPFAFGFECGRLWEMAKANEEEFSETVHAENAEMVLRMGEALGRAVRSEEIGNDWLEVTFAECTE